MNLVIFGSPGAGKGTQAELLGEYLAVPHISSGDTFRTMRHQQTRLAEQVRPFMDRGELVPDPLTISVILQRLEKRDTANGFILDGFPRTVAQAQALDQALAASDEQIDLALYIAVSPRTVIDRLTGRVICPACDAVYNVKTKPPQREMRCDRCGERLERRSDEAPDVIQARLDTYYRQTTPLKAYYRSRRRLLEIDGSRSESEVAADLRRSLAATRIPVPHNTEPGVFL